MRMDARRTTKVVVRTTNRGTGKADAAFSRQPFGTGLTGALALSLGLQIVAHYLLRLASRHHPRSATRRARVGLIQRFLASYPSRPRRKAAHATTLAHLVRFLCRTKR